MVNTFKKLLRTNDSKQHFLTCEEDFLELVEKYMGRDVREYLEVNYNFDELKSNIEDLTEENIKLKYKVKELEEYIDNASVED